MPASNESTPRSPAEPLIVYGSTCSYYTGKLEAYFRAKGIEYRLEPFSPSNMQRCARHTGVTQIPQVEQPDDSWLIDTTLIIERFERLYPEPRVTPADPAVAFVSALLEDYGDEWLWRPAMHYRWSFPETARLMSAQLAEHLSERRGPQWLKRRYWRHRQYGTFVRGDGVTAATRSAVEASYLDTLDALEEIFAVRPYILGGRPTEADFGFFASMFRHFASDPAPARIMRARAPRVLEWTARVWSSTPERLASIPVPESLPDHLENLLGAVSSIYLPYLDANAAAHAAGRERTQYDVQGVTFDEPTKPYRVWCRDRLQQRLVALGPAARLAVEHTLGFAAVARLAEPSPKPVPDAIGALPLRADLTRTRVVDSWWR